MISAIEYACDQCGKTKAATDTGWWVLTPYFRSARIERFNNTSAAADKAMELCSDACALKKLETVLAALPNPEAEAAAKAEAAAAAKAEAAAAAAPAPAAAPAKAS